jgi:hypothetical protein
MRATTIAAVIATAGLTSGGATACISDMTVDEAALAKEVSTR